MPNRIPTPGIPTPAVRKSSGAQPAAKYSYKSLSEKSPQNKTARTPVKSTDLAINNRGAIDVANAYKKEQAAKVNTQGIKKSNLDKKLSNNPQGLKKTNMDKPKSK